MPADGNARRAVVGALVGVVAVGLAAATLTSTRETDTGLGGAGGGSDGVIPLPPAREPPLDPVQIPFLGELFAAFVLVGLLVAAVWALFNRRAALKALAVAVVLAGLLFLLVEALASLDLSSGMPGPERGDPGMFGSDEGIGTDGNPQVPVPPLVLLALLALGVVLAAVALGRPVRGFADDEDDPDDDGGVAAAAVGRAAGRAAERIEDGTAVDNEVYRAWREMTDLLDVPNPEASTPGEFAEAASATGMSRTDVDELTRLFEDVRYGGTDPTPDLEGRAVEVFQRIESGYAEGEA